MSVSGLSDYRRNFHCVTVASVDLITPVLRDILTRHIKPVNLYIQIKPCLKILNLRKEQQAICFIPPASGVPDYNKFDVSLLYTLIRNLCHLPCPAQGWGNPKWPKATDTQISDDIERLRLSRNTYYAHRISAKISDNEFKDIWGNLTSAINRIQSGYNIDYKDELIRIQQIKFTLSDWEECVKILDALEDKPDIIIKGEDEIIIGDTAKIEADVCNVESFSWSITWQRRKEDNIKCIDTTMQKYSGSTKKKLVINDVCKEDEGEYQALLSFRLDGPEYKSRNSIRLYAVGERPFVNIIEVSSGSEGLTIHFNCGVLQRSPKVHLIEWSKNDKQLQNDNKYVVGGKDDRHLTIKSPTYEDRGNYTCKVTNLVGSKSKNIMLDVPSVKLLNVWPVLCGSKTTIKSEVLSTPKPEKIEWQKSKDGVDFHPIKEANGSKHTKSSSCFPLVIPKATFADKLYYRLLVWNKIGKGVSNTMLLNITGSLPNIKIIPKTDVKNRTLKFIGNVIIYDGSPEMQDFFWSKNNKEIDFVKSAGKLTEKRTGSPSLTIENVGPDDAGEYQLTAINAVGPYTSEAITLGAPKVSEEKTADEINGGHWITVTIKSIPEPFHVQWSAKRTKEDTFTPVDINDEEHEGTTVSLPHPVLFVRHKDILENKCFRIEVTNFIGRTELEISGDDTTTRRKIDGVENTIYNDDGEIFKFTILSSKLVKLFPPQKLDNFKFLIKSSNKVKNLTSLKEAKSVSECIEILQDEQLFTQKDVIYMQFLCQEADCLDLFKICKEYAEEQKSLCYFKKTLVNGYKEVEFHVQGDVSGYTKAYIHHVIKTVAVILECKEENIMLNGVRHSESFMISLSVKEVYSGKLLALKEKDCIKLRRLNIDYLIIDGESIHIERSKEDITTQREMLFTSLPLSVIVSKVLPIAENPPTLYTTNDHDSIQKRTSELLGYPMVSPLIHSASSLNFGSSGAFQPLTPELLEYPMVSPLIHSASSLNFGSSGAFQPKKKTSGLLHPSLMIPGLREPDSEHHSAASLPHHKKSGKWCSMHVQIAWKIHRHQQESPDVSKGGKVKSLDPLRCGWNLSGSHLHRPTDRSMSSFLLGMSSFSKPSPHPLTSHDFFGGLGKGESGFGTLDREMLQIPGKASPHEWSGLPTNRLFSCSLLSKPNKRVTEIEKEKEIHREVLLGRDRRREERERERRSSDHEWRGSEYLDQSKDQPFMGGDLRHPHSVSHSRSRSRSPLVGDRFGSAKSVTSYK